MKGIPTLSNLDFTDVQIKECNFAKTVMKNCVMQQLKTGSKNEKKKFDLRSCIFENADLSDTVFSFCDLKSVSFHKANLERAVFDKCNVTGANFSNATITGVSFT
ncbi:MAG: pentapeptide repeat-containing protein, partial [Nitrosotalea sp.]